MVLDIDSWSAFSVLAKVIVYGCGVTLSGGLFTLWLDGRVAANSSEISDTTIQASRRKLWPILFGAACLGALATELSLQLQVGAINQRGIAGMFDWFMLKLIGQSSVGIGNGLKLGAFLALGAALLVTRSSLYSVNRAFSFPPVLIAALVAALTAFAASFAFLGHVAPLGWLAKLAIIAHIGAVSIWLGSLLPLRLIVTARATSEALGIMRAFGVAGWGILAFLLAGGVYLLFELLGNVGQLISSPYGLLLSLKLLLVICLLALAATNKFSFVSRLASNDAEPLKRSIAGEMVLASVILLITAVFTTVTGPMESML